MTVEEINRFARIMVKRCGITKIRLTGGEPTTRADFAEILDSLGGLGVETLAMTTNGVLLHRHWESLKRAKVHFLNISLDTLQKDKFTLISNKPEVFWERTWDAIECAKELERQADIRSLKVNTVVMKHINDDEILDLIDSLTRDSPIQLRFIELMPFAGNNFSNKLLMTRKEILARITSSYELDRLHDSSSSSSTGTDLYQVPSYRGSVGIISSMTHAFCSSCNRLRLTADGQLRNCLFDSTSVERDLLKILRRGGSDDEIETSIRLGIKQKASAHGGVDVGQLKGNTSNNRPMIHIGG
jgi:cyclic pyranopterin phosphate synthase